MEEELRDVVMEVSHCNVDRSGNKLTNFAQANALAPNWGQSIFQSANEIAANTVFRNRLDEIQGKAASEKEWWEKRRATVQTEFMKELETPATSAKSVEGKTGSEDDAIMVESPPVTDQGSMRKKKGKD